MDEVAGKPKPRRATPEEVKKKVLEHYNIHDPSPVTDTDQ